MKHLQPARFPGRLSPLRCWALPLLVLGNAQALTGGAVQERRLTLTIESVSELDRLETLVDGKPVPAPRASERRVVTVLEVSFRDWALNGDFAPGFDRRFDQALRRSSMEMVDPQGGQHSSRSERASAYLAESLRFAWEGSELRARRLEPRGAGSEPSLSVSGSDLVAQGPLLAGLAAGPDWGLLQPEHWPEPGGSWSIPVEWLRQLREPGGDLVLQPLGDASGDRELLPPSGATAYSGTITGTLISEGGGLVRLGLVVDVETHLDLTPYLPPPEIEGGHRIEMLSDRIDACLRGSGEVWFQLEAGVATALAIDLKIHEVEHIDFGHSELALAAGTHEVRIETLSESTIRESIRAGVELSSRP